MARATNTNVEAMSSLRYAFEQYGYDASDVISLTRQVGVALDNALQGDAGKARALELLGADVEALQRLSPDAQLREIVRLIDQLEDRSQLNPITDTLFGSDDGARIQALAGDLERLEQQARDTGVAIGDDAAAQVEKFTELLRLGESTARGALNGIGQAGIDLTVTFAESVGILPDETEQAIDDMVAEIERGRERAQLQSEILGEAIRLGIINELQALNVNTTEELDDLVRQVAAAKTLIDSILTGVDYDPAQREDVLRGSDLHRARAGGFRNIESYNRFIEFASGNPLALGGIEGRRAAADAIGGSSGVPFRDDFLADIYAGTSPEGSFDPAYAAQLEREAQERLEAELEQQRLEALRAAREAAAAARAARSEQERLRREEERARAEARRSEIEHLQRQATLARRLDDPRAQAARFRELAGQARGTDAELSEDFEYYARQILQREDAREKREVEQEARERQRESRELETHERQVRRGGREVHIVNPGLQRPPVVINIYVNGDERPLSDLVRDEVIEGLQDFGSQISDVVATAGD